MAELDKSNLLYEGKAKRLYATTNPDELLVEFKDSLTAFDNVKKGEMSGKGVVNNQVSAIIMGLLNDSGIETNFVRLVDENHCIVKKVDIVMIEVIVRYEAQGSFCRRYGVEPGLKFHPPLCEIGYKNDDLHDPFLSDDSIPVFMGLCSFEEIRQIRYMAVSTGDRLCDIYGRQGIRLIDFKLEFGRYSPADGSAPRIILADEVTPDTCRLVDAKTGEKLDKDLFRFDLGDVGAGYHKLLERMQG